MWRGLQDAMARLVASVRFLRPICPRRIDFRHGLYAVAVLLGDRKVLGERECSTGNARLDGLKPLARTAEICLRRSGG